MPRVFPFTSLALVCALACLSGCDAADQNSTAAVDPASAPITVDQPVESAGTPPAASLSAPAVGEDSSKSAVEGKSAAVGDVTSSVGVVVDPALPEYQPAEGVSGTVKSIGSDTMNNLMTLWQEGFRKIYPSVKIEIEGKGSSSAPPALQEGTAAFGPMSREMKESEIDEFEAKFGYPPTALATSLDMLAVYVHRDNPIKGLTLAQVDAIFSKMRKLGYPNDIRTWGEIGLPSDWAGKSISLYGRNPASGTYGYFKEHVLGNGDFKDTVNQQPGSSSVVQAVGRERFAVGYSGIGYKTADVRAVPLAEEANGGFIDAAPENAYNGDYPLARPLLLYLNYKPGMELDPLRKEFIRYVFSRQGQSDVVKDGYLPVTAENAKEALRTIGVVAP